jgi:hypothetical protein
MSWLPPSFQSYEPSLTQGSDPLIVKTKITQNALAVCARRPSQPTKLTGRRAEMRDRTKDLRLFAHDRHDIPAMAYLLVRRDFLDTQHTRDNGIMARDFRLHFLSCVLHDNVIDRIEDHHHVLRQLAECHKPGELQSSADQGGQTSALSTLPRI